MLDLALGPSQASRYDCLLTCLQLCPERTCTASYHVYLVMQSRLLQCSKALQTLCLLAKHPNSGHAGSCLGIHSGKC